VCEIKAITKDERDKKWQNANLTHRHHTLLSELCNYPYNC
jgi:hypothetical protein